MYSSFTKYQLWTGIPSSLFSTKPASLRSSFTNGTGGVEEVHHSWTNHPSSQSTQVYYKEISKSLKAVTGVRAVQIYHHQVRNPERSSSNLNTSVQEYASRIHLDTAPFGCLETFKHFLSQNQEPELRQGRFVVVNAWRNISDLPIQRDHLALLDETSTVKPDDYVIADFFGNVRSQFLTNKTVRLHFS